MTTYKEALLDLSRECERLAAGLNTSSKACPCCDAQRFEAYEEELAARKLLGYADSLAKLAESTVGRGKDSGPAPFLGRHVGAKTEPAPGSEEARAYEMRGVKWDALWRRMVEGDDLVAVARDVAGLVSSGEHTHPSATRVLARINPFLRQHGVRHPADLDRIKT